MSSPICYDPGVIRTTSLTPNELKECIDFLVSSKLKSVRDFQTVEKSDLTYTLVLAYAIDDSLYPSGTLSLKIELPNGDSTSFAIALFRSCFDAKQTLENFISSNLCSCVIEKTETFLIEKVYAKLEL